MFYPIVWKPPPGGKGHGGKEGAAAASPFTRIDGIQPEKERKIRILR